jgi:hypothetical protein
MCVRREPLLRFMLDEDRAPSDGAADAAVSGRGDEEGLFLLLRAAGYDQRVVADAIVHHDHPLRAATFLRQAWRGGRSAARLVYKYRLRTRLDVLPFALALVTLMLVAAPTVLVSRWFLLAPATCMLLGVAAVAYNELCRKGKTLVDLLVTAPALTVYYALRVTAYMGEAVRLRLLPNDIEREVLSALHEVRDSC